VADLARRLERARHQRPDEPEVMRKGKTACGLSGRQSREGYLERLCVHPIVAVMPHPDAEVQ